MTDSSRIPERPEPKDAFLQRLYARNPHLRPDAALRVPPPREGDAEE